MVGPRISQERKTLYSSCSLLVYCLFFFSFSVEPFLTDYQTTKMWSNMKTAGEATLKEYLSYEISLGLHLLFVVFFFHVFFFFLIFVVVFFFPPRILGGDSYLIVAMVMTIMLYWPYNTKVIFDSSL